MSERLGTISFSERQSPFAGGGDTGAPSNYSEETAELIDEEVDRIVRSSYAKTVDLLTTYRPTLDRIAQELRRKETIDSKQLLSIMEETAAPISSTQFSPDPSQQNVILAPTPPAIQPGTTETQ